MSDTSSLGSGFVPLDCPICEYMIRDSKDAMTFQEVGCCVDCWIGFLEPIRKLRCDDKYLPNASEIKDYRKRIAVMMEKQNA